jgi:hypothetical protein
LPTPLDEGGKRTLASIGGDDRDRRSRQPFQGARGVHRRAVALLLRVLMAASHWPRPWCSTSPLPRVGGRQLFRPVDPRAVSLGILIYPLSVLLLTLAFPSR